MAMVRFSPICPAVGSLWQAAKIFSCSSRVLTNLNSSTCIATYTFIHVSRCRKREGGGGTPNLQFSIVFNSVQKWNVFHSLSTHFWYCACVRACACHGHQGYHTCSVVADRLACHTIIVPGENCTGTCTCHMYVIHMQPCINVKVALVLFLQLCVCG